MDKRRLLISLLAGLMAGQLFAADEFPIKVINTVRVGYDDNTYRNANGKETTFVKDIVDLSFRAALSEQTDVTIRSQFTLMDDVSGTTFNPNLYAILNHSVSPRLLLSLSEYYNTGDSSGKIGLNNQDTRYKYFENKVGASADYVLTGKDRLQGSLDYDILRHEDDVKSGLLLDTTTVEAGTSWKHDIVLQRTYSTVNLKQRWVEYDHQNSSFEATDLSAGLNHTFNPKLMGHVAGGMTQVRPDYPAPAKSDSSINPLLNAGLVYSPSPRTRLSSDFSHSYSASEDKNYGGQTLTDLRFGAEHDITAKLTAKATADFAKSEYDSEDNQAGTASNNQDRMDLGLRLTYQLNRMHFLEAGVTRSTVKRDSGGDWEQNVVDVGWRVELN